MRSNSDLSSDPTFFAFPTEVSQSPSFSTLNKIDCLALRLTSRSAFRFAENISAWVKLAKEEWGANISSFEEYLMVYTFQRGLIYAEFLSKNNKDYCKKIVERQNQFFTRAYGLADQLSQAGTGNQALVCYVKGYIQSVGTLGVPRDYPNGMANIQRAAQLGNTDAMLLLGLVHLGFPGIYRIFTSYCHDLDYKFPIYIHSYWLESETPQFRSAPDWTPVNLEGGLDFIHRAIAAGSDEASCVLATTAIKSIYNRDDEELKKILAILTQAANKEGGRHSAYILGRLLIELPPEKGGNIQLGVQYIERAADRKNPEARYWLGRAHLGDNLSLRSGMYLRPRFLNNLVLFSVDQSRACLRQAAPHHGAAAYFSGMFNEEGVIRVKSKEIPIPVDLDAAIECYKSGYDANLDKECAMALGKLYLEKLHKKEEALFWLEKAAELGEMEAWHMLAALHLCGNTRLGLKVDNEKADRYLAELLPFADQYFRVPGIIIGSVKFAQEMDGVEREPNIVQFVKWSCRIAAKDGFLGGEFTEVLKDLAQQSEEAGKSDVAVMLNELAEMTSSDTSKPELVEKLIQVAPHIIQKKFLDEHLVFLNSERDRPRQKGMWE